MSVTEGGEERSVQFLTLNFWPMTFRRYAALSQIGRRSWSATTPDPAALKLSSKAISLSNMFASCVHVWASAV